MLITTVVVVVVVVVVISKGLAIGVYFVVAVEWVKGRSEELVS